MSIEHDKDKDNLHSNTISGGGQDTLKDVLSIPTYNLQEGIQKTIFLIQQLKSKKKPVVVAVAGGSNSGKTTVFSQQLKEYFGEKITILSMDDYSKGHQYIMQQRKSGNPINYDHPEYINIDMLDDDIQTLKTNSEILRPTFDFSTGEPGNTIAVTPNDIIIVEGLFALDDQLQKTIDLSVFVDTSTIGRMVRRLSSDRVKRSKSDILHYFLTCVEPMHQKYIEKSKINASLIIQNNYDAETESKRISSYNDAEEYSQGYNYSHLVSKQETLKIYEKDKKLFFLYLGPIVYPQSTIRPKLEFPIDDEIWMLRKQRFGI